MKLLFFIVILLSGSVTLLAQTALSLEECVRLAWKQNPSLRDRVIDVKEANADYRASIGSFLPRVLAKSEMGKSFGRSVEPENNSYTTETFEQGSVGIEMTLSLFEGFSRINQVRFRKMMKEKSEWELKDKRNELAYQVMNAYFKVLLEEKLLDLVREQSKLSERYFKQTETFVELGLRSVSDLQEVKARREGDIYRSQSRENSYGMSLLYLSQLMNIRSEDSLKIQDTICETEVPSLVIPRVDSLFARSLYMLPSMRALEWKRRAVRKEYAMAGGAFAPSVYANFAVVSNCYNTFFSSKQFGGNVGKYIGIGVSFPLLDGLERLTSQRKRKLNIYRMENEMEQEKLRLYTEVEQTLLSLRSGYDNHRQAISQLEAERLVLKESERKWEEGLISVFQLMETRNRFIAAKAELVRIRLEVEMLSRMERYYREGEFF